MSVQFLKRYVSRFKIKAGSFKSLNLVRWVHNLAIDVQMARTYPNSTGQTNRCFSASPALCKLALREQSLNV